MVIQLGHRPTYPIRDDEAYSERLAIVQESWTDRDFMEPHRMANEDATRTRYSLCATAALNDQNWCPLMEWMVEVTMKHGADVAVSIWFEIQAKVEQERVVRGLVDDELRLTRGANSTLGRYRQLAA